MRLYRKFSTISKGVIFFYFTLNSRCNCHTIAMYLSIESDSNNSHKHTETPENLHIKQSIDTIRKLICDTKDVLHL